MAQARSAQTRRKKKGPGTYGTDRANEVNKMFIIWLFFLHLCSGTAFVLRTLNKSLLDTYFRRVRSFFGVGGGGGGGGAPKTLNLSGPYVSCP